MTSPTVRTIVVGGRAAIQVSSVLKLVGVMEYWSQLPPGLQMSWKTSCTQPPLWFSACVTNPSISESAMVWLTFSGVRVSNAFGGGIDSAYGQPSQPSGET